jgi:hypothetical protein
MERKMVTEKTKIMDNHRSWIVLDKFIKELVKLQSQGWTAIEADVDYDIYGGQEYSVIATKTRKENDTEYNKRIKETEQQKESRRLKYEQLKKEFEG